MIQVRRPVIEDKVPRQQVPSAGLVQKPLQRTIGSPAARAIDTVRDHPVRYARGYGGQLLYLVPDLGLTVVITSDPTRPARSGGYFGALRRFLADDVIPAAEV